MIFPMLLTCTLVLVGAQRVPKSIGVQRRMGYSPNVVHAMQGYGDLRAEGSVNANYPHQQLNSYKGRVKYTNVQQPQGGSHFNVGYNLRFKEEPNKNFNRFQQQRYPQITTGKKFENAEVIRGTLKNNEKVRAPLGPDMSPQQFVSQAYQTQKQIRPQTQTKYTSAQIRFSPSSSSPGFNNYNTQQNIFKDVVRSTRPEPVQYDNTKWESITPATQTENAIQADEFDKYFRKEAVRDNQQFASFNHEIALKNSETFDFSNVHGDISFGDSSNRQFIDNVSGGSDRHSTTLPASVVSQNKIPVDLNIEAHIPENLKGVQPLPIDTSLLQDPVLTTSLQGNQDVSKYGKIPIHFDVRQIQAAMQEELHKTQKFAPHNYNPSGYGNAVNYQEDPYKIVSMRPPPPAAAQNLRY
ncbi:uncharacterized protein [Euwallacea fornicatus]|uniref:uncharacterized protein n=1 Tax=Euwallacea fornicatus TaxID=995702 RepID=UPI00338EB829